MSEHTNAAPFMACYVLMRRGNELAFVLRENTGWQDGNYGLPAGRVEWGETAAEGALREAKEEAGVTIAKKSLRHVFTLHRHGPDVDWIDIFFEADEWQGELTNTEPDKHHSAVWLNTKSLPDNIVPNQKFALQQITLGVSYAEFGWENS